MPKKKEYIRGENVGPHKSIIFLAELPPMKNVGELCFIAINAIKLLNLILLR